MSDAMEAEQYMDTQFKVASGQGTHINVNVKCGVKTDIAGLKGDLADQFGIPPEQQVWYHKSTQLRNGKTLLEYGFGEMDPESLIHITGNHSPTKFSYCPVEFHYETKLAFQPRLQATSKQFILIKYMPDKLKQKGV